MRSVQFLKPTSLILLLSFVVGTCRAQEESNAFGGLSELLNAPSNSPLPAEGMEVSSPPLSPPPSTAPNVQPTPPVTTDTIDAVVGEYEEEEAKSYPRSSSTTSDAEGEELQKETEQDLSASIFLISLAIALGGCIVLDYLYFQHMRKHHEEDDDDAESTLDGDNDDDESWFTPQWRTQKLPPNTLKLSPTDITEENDSLDDMESGEGAQNRRTIPIHVNDAQDEFEVGLTSILPNKSMRSFQPGSLFDLDSDYEEDYDAVHEV